MFLKALLTTAWKTTVALVNSNGMTVYSNWSRGFISSLTFIILSNADQVVGHTLGFIEDMGYVNLFRHCR